jgi:Carboxypeptidase regulatory-like domain
MRRSVHLRFLDTCAQRTLLCAGVSVFAAFGWGCTATVHPSSQPVSQTPGAQTFGIAGTVAPATGGNGATVTLSGAASATATANSTGTYSFTGLAAGTYAVTPSNAGFTFVPNTQAATITAANITGLNFTAAAQTGPTASISGTITPTAGGSGATVLLSGPTASTTTASSSGSYTFTGLPSGTYTVTPSESAFAFTPGNQNVTLSGSNQTGINFTAAHGTAHSVALTWTPSTSTVSGYNLYRSTVSASGYTKLNSSLVASLSYSDTTVQAGTTYFYVATSVDSGGDESTNSNQATAAIP